MTFIAPLALLGLAAATIPILLHLVQKREPPVREFPAIRYLEDATRDHRRRLRLRNLLLLAVRTALIVALVLAAAGPVANRAVPFGVHSPIATALVIDNSASSGAVMDGEPTLTALLDGARRILDRATPADRLWLILADGVPRPGTREELLARIERVTPMANRLDLGEAVGIGRALVEGSGRKGEVIVLTDAQRSAVVPAIGEVPLTVVRPEEAAPSNRSFGLLDPGVQPWGAEGGRIDLLVNSTDSAPVALALSVDGQPARDLLTVPGVPSGERLPLLGAGWRTIRATLPPDELRLDDVRETAIHVAPATAVSWDPTDRFLTAAFEVLLAEGRVTRGFGVRVGGLGSSASIVVPPEDPSLLGAVNRSLEARGVSWRFGSILVAPTRTDSSALLGERVLLHRRVRLESLGSGGETLVTADGEPWLVRSGNVVLVGSRFDPSWTQLPARAAFVPLLDRLTTRTVRGAPSLPEAVVGSAVTLPARTTALGTRTAPPTAVEGGAPWIPQEPGVYWLLSGADTLGAVSVSVDPRESDLTRADDKGLESAWPGVLVADLEGGAEFAFASGGRGDLRPMLLIMALILIVAESLLAGRRAAR